jgi:hypothetical protein
MAAITALKWLHDNGHDEILVQIKAVIAAKKASKKKTRRNWWDVLAGTLDGRPREDSGILFPILAAARRRKGWPVVPGELQKDGESPPPAIVDSARWRRPTPSKRLRKTDGEQTTSPPRAPSRQSGGQRRRSSSSS